MTRKRRTLEVAEWYSIRPVRSFKPATYRCPLCGLQLHAMSDHVLIAPEGDTTRRRHAHISASPPRTFPAVPRGRGCASGSLD